MATLTRNRTSNASATGLTGRHNKVRARWMPRRCTTVAIGLVIAGLTIPLLMAAELLPITLSLGFVALVLMGAGGGLLLTRCGDI